MVELLTLLLRCQSTISRSFEAGRMNDASSSPIYWLFGNEVPVGEELVIASADHSL
jgi:hypothetical protein